ncbi:MAG: 2-hydroxychromene-2-carboxylate isomerase [Thiolinea sp.]
MAHIDYYTFPLSPFTYLAGNDLENIAEKQGASITYKPFNLMKIFAETNTPAVPDRHPSVIAYRTQELKRIAKRRGTAINLKPAFWPTNPVPACHAMIAAQEAGGGDLAGLVQGILRACWLEEQDISQDAIINACLTANGFAADLMHNHPEKLAAIYEQNTVDALNSGVFGAPTYIVGDEIFWGQDRLDYLDDYLTETE